MAAPLHLFPFFLGETAGFEDLVVGRVGEPGVLSRRRGRLALVEGAPRRYVAEGSA